MQQHRAAESPRFPCQGLSLQRIAGLTAVTLAMVFVNKLGIAGNAIFFTAIVVMNLAAKPGTAIAAMSLGLLALVANTAFVVKTSIWSIARFINLFSFAGRFALASAGDRTWIVAPSYMALMAFVFVAAVCSVLSGYYVHISLLKLFSFWIGMTGFFACIHSIRSTRIDTTEWFVSLATSVAALCVLALSLGVASNFKEHAISRGLYNLGLYHSQTMGPMGALFVTYLVCVVLFAGHRNRYLCLPLVVFLAYCVRLTGSRTGMGTLILGLLTCLTLAFAWNRRGLDRLRLNVSRIALIALLILASGILLVAEFATGGAIGGAVKRIVLKTDKESVTLTFEGATASRQGSIEYSLANFRQSPIYGIGFQVATTDHFKENATLFYAPVEKGFLPTALLEEVGVVGTLFFVIFVGAFLYQLVRERNIPGTTMFLTLLFTNLGEASFFALAGHGAFGWMLVVAGILLGDRCVVVRQFGKPALQPHRHSMPLQEFHHACGASHS